VNDEDRGLGERRREDRQCDAAERQRRERAEDDASYHEGSRSGDYSRRLARHGQAVDAESGRAAKTDEAALVQTIRLVYGSKKPWERFEAQRL
jgi:hypothetical protein